MARDGGIWRALMRYFQTLYLQWGGSDSAMLAFIEEIKPTNPNLAKAMQADFYWRRGRDYQRSNQIDVEIAHHIKAISLSAHSDALTDLGHFYMLQVKCDEAVELFKRNLKENDEWDLHSLESLMQAHDCASNYWQFGRLKAKRSALFSRYRAGE